MRDDSRIVSVKLDQILKSLFEVSDKVLINMMNSLFDEHFNINETSISFEKEEFVKSDYDFDIIRGDVFLKLINSNKPFHYHIELQTKNDSTMVLRMFEHGFNKAKELVKYENKEEKDETIIYIPKQLVIYIEQNYNIKDELKMKLIFPDGQQIKYMVPVMKYWEYNDRDLLEQKMYPLLPLQLFKLRYKMLQITRNKIDNKQEQLNEAILEAKKIAELIAKESKGLFDEKEITGDDLHKILLAIANLFEYLNGKFGEDERIEEEVRSMTKTLYDPAVEERAEKRSKIEIAKNLLDVLDIKTIAEKTGLSIKEVEKLEK